MMYKIHTGHDVNRFPNADIAILVARLPNLLARDIDLLYTDRHALLRTARFYNSVDDLDKIDWGIIRSGNFKRNNSNPEGTERYQAEALIYEHLPINRVACVVCYDDSCKQMLEAPARQAGVSLNILTRPSWYFR